MAKVFNWGIIGLGKMAHRFADDLLLVPNARLHAVVSSSTDRARAFSNKYKVPYAYGNYGDIVLVPDLDAVYIASSNSYHCAHTLLCLKHNIPVLCEKPFAMNAVEVEQMAGLAYPFFTDNNEGFRNDKFRSDRRGLIYKSRFWIPSFFFTKPTFI